MISLANFSIRQKLTVMTAAGITFSLLLAGVAFLVNDVRSYRAECAINASTLATIVGSNATAALEFEDSRTANEILSSLKSLPSIERVVLRKANGEEFAAYNKPSVDILAPDTDVLEAGAHFTADGFLEVVSDIDSDGARVGTLWLRSNLDELQSRIFNYLGIAVTTLVVALLAGILLARQMQGYFTGPVLELVTTMKRVETEHDYSLRVAKFGRDELGVLCDGFNEMLSRTQAAQNDLRAAHDELEDRVGLRTAELQVALTAAETSNRAKSQFLANMSHEIRTPMTSILGYADLVDDEVPDPSKSREHLDVIRRNGRHLMNVINDILDVSKIEAGKMTVELVACEPARIVADVMSLMRPRAKMAGLELEVTYQGEIPERIQTDPTRLHQILTNLLGNAIKFTPRGRVDLVLSTTVNPGGEKRLQFEVRDTGIGLTPAHVCHMFVPFSQADETMTRRYGGTGLGLTISRSLARLLGGDITLVSEPECGSTFTVTIAMGSLEGVRMLTNCRECEVRPTRVLDASSAMAGRILLVEDGPDNRLLISTVLKKAGLTVAVAENGQLGLEAALEANEEGRPFDLVLMDMQMPVLDGYSAARKLREAGYALPIVALTAHAMSHDAQKCLDAGCNGYTTKPIIRKELLDLVRTYVEGRQLAVATLPEAATSDVTPSAH